jgi:hypothetical protein
MAARSGPCRRSAHESPFTTKLYDRTKEAVSTKNGAPPRRPLAHDAGWHEAKELAS